MKKYLLSTGSCTTKFEVYLLDLFKLNLSIFDGDIPNSVIGFNFILSDLHKDDILISLESRIKSLIDRINSKHNLDSRLVLDSLELLSESRARIIVSMNEYSETVDIKI